MAKPITLGKEEEWRSAPSSEPIRKTIRAGFARLFPLAGRTLVEYQARCAAAAGAAPIVLVVDRIPPALNEALERLQAEGVSVTTVSDGNEAASRFSSGEMVLLIGDGIAPPAELLAGLAEEAEPAIIVVPDDEQHQHFERIDAVSRWAGVALVDSQLVGATAAMLGDWDLQSTLLRRSLQSGALTIPVAPEAGEPVLASRPDELAALDRQLIIASRGSRRDWASRYVLPIVEEYATEGLLNTGVKPERLIDLAVLLGIAAIFAFSTGWLWAGLALLVLSTPLDLVARRLATLRLRPLSPRSTMRRLLWPVGGPGAARARLVGFGQWRRLGRALRRRGRGRLRRSGADRARPARPSGPGLAVLEAQRDPGDHPVRGVRRVGAGHRRFVPLCGGAASSLSNM